MKTIDDFGYYWTALLNRRWPTEASPGDHASPRVLPQSVAWPTLYARAEDTEGGDAGRQSVGLSGALDALDVCACAR